MKKEKCQRCLDCINYQGLTFQKCMLQFRLTRSRLKHGCIHFSRAEKKKKIEEAPYET